jgi:hypothetical protein
MRIQTTFHFFYKGFVMKKIALIAAMGLMGMGSAMAQSLNVQNTFDVTVNLLSRCTLTAPANTTLAFNDYTAFGGSISSNSVVYTLNCTRGFGAPVVTFNDLGANGTTAGNGVVAGLQYTIDSAIVATGAGTAADATSIGTASTRSITLTGQMVGGQAGTCTAASCSGTQARTLTITY